ncbi:MAG: hypothetical protein HIU83_17400 [Proteobacteria bacterium]|nr:hypothetical protein [Pseudomonadota bacterium]
MKTTLIAILLCSLLCVTAEAETVMVTTRENAVRNDCRFFAPVKFKVLLGDRLTVNGRKGDWLLVSAKGFSGCIHKSAVEERNFATAGRGASLGRTSTDEVSLAGKGFNPQVESGYRTSGKNLNYAAVDEISHLSVSDKKLDSFIRQGGLIQP